jgi:hypothetical protein
MQPILKETLFFYFFSFTLFCRNVHSIFLGRFARALSFFNSLTLRASFIKKNALYSSIFSSISSRTWFFFISKKYVVLLCQEKLFLFCKIISSFIIFIHKNPHNVFHFAHFILRYSILKCRVFSGALRRSPPKGPKGAPKKYRNNSIKKIKIKCKNIAVQSSCHANLFYTSDRQTCIFS